MVAFEIKVCIYLDIIITWCCDFCVKSVFKKMNWPHDPSRQKLTQANLHFQFKIQTDEYGLDFNKYTIVV